MNTSRNFVSAVIAVALLGGGSAAFAASQDSPVSASGPAANVTTVTTGSTTSVVTTPALQPAAPTFSLDIATADRQGTYELGNGYTSQQFSSVDVNNLRGQLVLAVEKNGDAYLWLAKRSDGDTFTVTDTVSFGSLEAGEHIAVANLMSEVTAADGSTQCLGNYAGLWSEDGGVDEAYDVAGDQLTPVATAGLAFIDSYL